ncbi:MAG: ABC transporter ATP-binding protein [Alphaproteobacteria bacterium]|nr:ABC transporter ATP-binding protein [Alphaproteobacteria bacterium]
MTDSFVSLRSLRKNYGQVRVLDDVSLDIARNQFVSLLGHSGCGKTTTLRIVLGFLQADCGSVLIDGRDMTDVSPRHRGIGMVFQSYALWPHMTIYENVAFGLRVRKVAEPEVAARVGDVVARLHLGGLEQRLPRELSGGQQQRVALARALVIDPPLLLLDEPLSNLDRQLREDMRLELKHLQKRIAQTTIYVTHDQDEALSLSDRVVVMNRGRIEQQGTPQEIYYEPRTEFVARFIGKATFLDVAIEAVDPGGRARLRARDGTPIVVERLRQAAGHAPGDRALLAVRPEEAVLVPATEPGALRARVVEHLFLGSVYRYQLALADGSDVFIDSRGPIDGGADAGLRFAGGCLVPKAPA